MYLNNTWSPSVTVIATGGLPNLHSCRNVIIPSCSLRLAIRLPPTISSKEASLIIEDKLTKDVPYNCKVKFEITHHIEGWCPKRSEMWLTSGIKKAGELFFGKTGFFGMGGAVDLRLAD